jgi:hypothetical protein
MQYQLIFSNLNDIVPDNFSADQTILARVKMPNRHGFIWKDPRPDTHDKECGRRVALNQNAVRVQAGGRRGRDWSSS